ncbi:MAG: hemerythrin domain-containing protein [Sideroxyarcus sp.]|nr:hemerythrin domain-containing protein [Sideroxyarcus sp.]
MKTILEFMTTAHKTCDDDFARAEEAALSSKWSEAGTAFNRFRHAMAQHFRMEEAELFPALLSAGGPAGPVQVMLMEHAQINDLIGQMATALDEKDAQSYGGISETLLIVMQQHNHKEEQILYPIADHILAPQREALLIRMQSA